MKSPFPAYWIFADDRGLWSWKFATTAGEVVATSRHSYATQQDCVRAIQLMRATNSLATFGTIEDVEINGNDVTAAESTDGLGQELNLTDESAPWAGAGTGRSDAVDHIPYMLKGDVGAGGRR